MITVKVWFHNVNAGKFANLQYVGSFGIDYSNASNADLLARADAIGGALYGPVIAQVSGETDLRQLRI